MRAGCCGPKFIEKVGDFVRSWKRLGGAVGSRQSAVGIELARRKVTHLSTPMRSDVAIKPLAFDQRLAARNEIGSQIEFPSFSVAPDQMSLQLFQRTLSDL